MLGSRAHCNHLAISVTSKMQDCKLARMGTEAKLFYPQHMCLPSVIYLPWNLQSHLPGGGGGGWNNVLFKVRNFCNNARAGVLARKQRNVALRSIGVIYLRRHREPRKWEIRELWLNKILLLQFQGKWFSLFFLKVLTIHPLQYLARLQLHRVFIRHSLSYRTRKEFLPGHPMRK